MRYNLANNAGSRLAKAVTAISTTIEVESAASFPAVPFWLTLARSEEIVLVTAVAGNALTVERAQQGTTAKDYIAGTEIWGNFTKGHYDSLADKDYVDSQIESVPKPDLTGFATKQEVSTVEDKLGNHQLDNVKHITSAERTKWDGAVSDIGTKSALKTTDKTNLVNAVNELFTDVSNGKQQVGTAITGKGGTVPANPTFIQLVTAINGMPGGLKLEPGENVIFSSVPKLYNSIAVSPYDRYQKIIEAKMHAGGIIRTSILLKSISYDTTAYARVYVNGVAKGVERVVTPNNQATFTEDIDVRAGDLLQIYAKSGSSSTRDFEASLTVKVGNNSTVTPTL